MTIENITKIVLLSLIVLLMFTFIIFAEEREGSHIIEFKANESVYYMDGEIREISTKNKIIDGIMFVDIATAAESLGFKEEDVFWNGETMTLTFCKDNDVIQLTVGSSIMKFNGLEFKMYCSVIIADGRTYIPIRYIAEPLGASTELIYDKLTITFYGKSDVEGYIYKFNVVDNATLRLGEKYANLFKQIEDEDMNENDGIEQLTQLVKTSESFSDKFTKIEPPKKFQEAHKYMRNARLYQSKYLNDALMMAISRQTNDLEEMKYNYEKMVENINKFSEYYTKALELVDEEVEYESERVIHNRNFTPNEMLVHGVGFSTWFL